MRKRSGTIGSGTCSLLFEDRDGALDLGRGHGLELGALDIGAHGCHLLRFSGRVGREAFKLPDCH